MKVIYIHQYFVTPTEPGGTRSYWISQELIRRGHHVSMITGCNKNHPNPCKENIDGIDVIYVKNKYSNYMGAGQRIISFIKYVFRAINAARKEKDVDIVFATSTPLTVGAIAIWLKWTKGWKYVFEVRDLWPEGLIQEGITNPIVVWALRLLERCSYEKSEHVISLSPGMEEGVLKVGTPKEKSTMVPNMSKPDKFFPHDPNQDIIKEFGIDMSKFNLIHFGAMGFDNHLEYIVEAARLAQEQGYSDLNFIFLGDGSTKPAMEELTRTKVGNFDISDAIRLSELERLSAEDRISDVIITLTDIFSDLEGFIATPVISKLLRNGNVIDAKSIRQVSPHLSDAHDGQRVRMYDSEHNFLGVYEYKRSRDIYKPYKMFLN